MLKNKIILFVFLLSQVVTAQIDSNLTLLSNWKSPLLLNDTSFNTYNEIWAWENNGREYAIIGSILGTHWVDITNPQSPTEVDFEYGAEFGGFVVHRDFHNFGNYLYAVCDEGNASTLQIFDMSFLPDSVHKVYDSDSLFTNSHNIFIDTATQKLYVCYARKMFSNLNKDVAVYSLANPLSPTFLGFVPEKAHDVYVKNDTVYLNNENRGLYFFDASPLPSANATFLGSLTSYPDQGYNHSGWPSEDGKHYFFADETHGKQMKSVDITNFNNIVVKDVFGSNYSPTSIPHNQIVKGDSLYVSHYYDGLRIYNVSNPSNVVEVAYYDTYLGADGNSYKGAWGVYPFLPSGNIVVSDMQEGLMVFQFTDLLTDVKTNAVNQLNYFPNPFQNHITIENLQKLNISHYQLIDLKGQLIKSGSIHAAHTTLHFDENLQNGLYFLKLSNSTESFHIKIVKSNF